MLQVLFYKLFLAVAFGYVRIGLIFLAACVTWRAFTIYRIHRNRPRNIYITSKSYSIGKWVKNFDFITNAPTHILRTSRKLGYSSSFAIPSLVEHQVLVAGQQDVEALCNSSEGVLSFHEAMTDRMKHYYTMYGFEHNNIDPHDNVPIRAVKVLLRMHIPVLRPLIRRKIREGFETAVANGHRVKNWSSVSIFQLSKMVIEESNAQVILGDELGNNPECVRAAIRYSTDAVITAEICRQLPPMFTPIIATTLMRWSGAMDKVANFIRPVVEERMRTPSKESSNATSYNDCIQWTIDSSHTPAQRATPRLVAQIIGILLASSHQMSMVLVYIIYALCDHPEYIEPLRKEIVEAVNKNSKDPLKEMHLLDSFLTETSRLYPPDALTVQRKVKKPFTLPSGAVIPTGNLIAVPVLAQARNPEVFPNPETFDGRRFLLKDGQTKDKDAVSRFTDVRYSFSFWGAPRKGCPGRWYVSETLKQAMVHLLANYDFELEDEHASRFMYWTTAIFPRPARRILLKERGIVC
ncbi:cytochrome P450 [Trematosphaeria pertusa]|uniref:Cytochrome P450 n=1 Tax=Trematosphaeria pertusa TaxID=390896 RepID=A0A6A6HX88_9PLEO|nr:cytochrome P450 [Trematosphaeria pertusa]KAF2242509.1 cytochrome P450 [Trematosphaeria pertusa]